MDKKRIIDKLEEIIEECRDKDTEEKEAICQAIEILQKLINKKE